VIAAAVIGVIGAIAWWVPSYPPDPWATVIARLVWIGAVLLSTAAAYALGARGTAVGLAAGLGVVATFLAWPVILFVLVVIGLVIETVAV
jgi:hypothetical protein